MRFEWIRCVAALVLCGATQAYAEEDEEDPLDNPPPPVEEPTVRVEPTQTSTEAPVRSVPRIELPEIQEVRTSTMGRRISWNVLGAPRGSRAAVQVELGFASIPRASLQVAVSDEIVAGARVGLSFAGRRPGQGFKPGLEVVGLLRYEPPVELPFELGLVLEPGARVGGEASGQHFLLGLSAQGSSQVGDQTFVGGTFSVPAAIAVGGGAESAVSVEAGPFVETHLTPGFALTLDVRAGLFAARSGPGLSLLTLVGCALRI